MSANIPFLRRIGPAPACMKTVGCPDIFELANGDFAIIGSDMTGAAGNLPADAGCAPHERIIRVPRSLLVNAKRDIPDAV